MKLKKRWMASVALLAFSFGIPCRVLDLKVARAATVSSYQRSQAFYLTDHLGSTRLVTDESGTEQARYAYYPFGALRKDSALEQLASYNTYTGQKSDTEIDLMYYGARYYDPTLARFTSRDPALSEPPYAYVRNNPISYTDPTGNIVEGMVFAPQPKDTMLFLVDGSKLKSTNNDLSTGLGDRHAAAVRGHVEYVENKYGITWYHPHGAGSDEYYAYVPREMASQIAEEFPEEVIVKGKRISLFHVNMVDVTGMSEEELRLAYENLQKTSFAHPLLGEVQEVYIRRAWNDIESIEENMGDDPRRHLKIIERIRFHADGSRRGKRSLYEHLKKTGKLGTSKIGGFLVGATIEFVFTGDASAFDPFAPISGELSAPQCEFSYPGACAGRPPQTIEEWLQVPAECDDFCQRLQELGVPDAQ